MRRNLCVQGLRDMANGGRPAWLGTETEKDCFGAMETGEMAVDPGDRTSPL